jgi:hypothetical protein
MAGLLDNPNDAALMQLGLGLLQAGGPSRMPVSLGQAIGGAGSQALDTYRQTEQANRQKQMQDMQMQQQRAQAEREAQQQKFLQQAAAQITDPQERAFAQAFPKEWAHAKFAAQKTTEPKLVTVMTPQGPMQKWMRPGEAQGVDIGAPVDTKKPDTPFYQFLPTEAGYAVGNARTGQIAPGVMGGSPVIRASDSPRLQGDIAQAKEVGKTLGEERTKAALDAPRIIDNAETAMRHVDELLAHPGFSQAVGKSSMLGVQKIPGTDAYDFMSRLDQIKGGAFLEAFNSLKGGGQITEVEGKKATDAIARMNNSTSEKEFKAAAEDFKSVVRTGLNRAKMKAKPVATPTQPAQPGGVKFLGFE